jgi:mRNA interferase RelE/StbE
VTEVQYALYWTELAKEMLRKIADRRIQEVIVQRAEGLVFEPEKQGKPLGGELVGFRSLRAVGQRYRIIYRVEHRKVWVTIVAVGIRKEKDRSDIYTLAQKLVKLHLVQ